MQPICGDLYRTYCRTCFDPRGYVTNPEGKSDFYFVKIDCLEEFADKILPDITRPFVLISGDGDQPLGPWRVGLQKILKSPKLVRWLGLNVCIIHPKVFSIPIGVAYSYHRQQMQTQIPEVAAMNVPKERPVYASYLIPHANERKKCFDATGGLMFPYIKYNESGHKDYLLELAKSSFNISPNGGGFDCFRHWESIYLKTIPIVTDDNLNVQFYKDMPFLFIRDWNQYKSLVLTEDLRKRIWSDFDLSRLDFDRVMEDALTKPHPILYKKKLKDIEHVPHVWRRPLPEDTWINKVIENPPLPEKEAEKEEITVQKIAETAAKFEKDSTPEPKTLPHVPKELRTVLPKHYWSSGPL